MFVSDEATLDVGFDEALGRLEALAGNGVLTQVSVDAYSAGSLAGAPRPPLSCFGDLTTRPDRAVLAVRWATAGRSGGLFPLLDADLTLTPAGPRAALLQLAGVYRTRAGDVGHRMATVTIADFLNRVVETITTAAAG
jgi:hypothetical protein